VESGPITGSAGGGGSWREGSVSQLFILEETFVIKLAEGKKRDKSLGSGGREENNPARK